MNMKNTDLVWIEGRSMGWAFPTEIEVLRPFLPEAEGKSAPMETFSINNERPGSKIFVSLPKETLPGSERSNWEERAEINRNRAFEKQETETLVNNYSKSLEEVENEYTSRMAGNHKKKKTISGKKIALATVLLIGCAGGWLLADMAFTNTNKSGGKISTAQAAIPPMAMEAENPESNTEEKNITAIKERSTSTKKQNSNSIQSIPLKNKKKAPLKSKPEITNQVPILIEEPPPAVEPTESRENKPVVEKPEIKTEEKPATEKKRSIKEKISDWLKGGKELGKQSTTEEKVFIDISDEVRVRVDKDPSDWMMGVKGQKLVVSNRSEYTLNAAVIELQYYSEENSLLDKKKLEISGLAKGKSKSIPIPDHKMADHVEAIVSSAKGEAGQK
jgi:hypothetical protein